MISARTSSRLCVFRYLETQFVLSHSFMNHAHTIVCIIITITQARLKPITTAHEDVSFVTLSDLWLDHPRTLPSLKIMFEGYANADVRPFAFVFCGNFSVKGYEGFASLERYTGELLWWSNQLGAQRNREGLEMIDRC